MSSNLTLKVGLMGKLKEEEDWLVMTEANGGTVVVWFTLQLIHNWILPFYHHH